MSLFVKICGITDRAAAIAARDAGADALGFVFAASPRRVSVRRAADIAKGLASDVLLIAVFLDPTQTEVDDVVSGFRCDFVQANHDREPILPDDVGFLPVYRDDDPPVSSVAKDRFLFEAARSGAGETSDWEVARNLTGMGQLILAGGLHPENVEQAIREVDPGGVDVSSGVESRPGAKDPALIERFVDAARRGASTPKPLFEGVK